MITFNYFYHLIFLMTSKTNLFLFLTISAIMIASSFAINDAFAAKDDKIKFQDIFGDPDFDAIFGDPDFLIGSLQGQIGDNTFRIDSFFDVFTEISVHDADVDAIDIELIQLSLRADESDSHVSVLKEKDSSQDGEIARIDTEIVALNLRVDEVTAPTDLVTSSYIKFDGVDGEAQDNTHKNWSDLLSFEQGQRSPDAGTTGESRRRGDVIMEDVVVVKELDKSSPKIAEAVNLGKIFPKVEIHVTATYGDAGRLTYYAYELTNVLVTSYNISGSGQAEDVPVENFSLNFEEIKVTYTEYASDGTKKGDVGYDWKVEEGVN